MNSLSLIENKIRIYFESDSYFKEFLPKEFLSTTSLINLGMFDSLSIINVVSFLEKEFSITFNTMDINEENFSTIDSMVKFISNKSK